MVICQMNNNYPQNKTGVISRSAEFDNSWKLEAVVRSLSRTTNLEVWLAIMIISQGASIVFCTFWMFQSIFDMRLGPILSLKTQLL